MNKLLLALLLLSGLAIAQTPSAPRPENERHFWTKRNVSLIALAGSSLAADGFTTQRVLQWPFYGEANPLTQPFGRSRTATVGLDATAFAVTVGGMYVAHRKGWRHAEWIVPLAVASVESGFAIHNARIHIPCVCDLGGPPKGVLR
jgi:hypothetical protein